MKITTIEVKELLNQVFSDHPNTKQILKDFSVRKYSCDQYCKKAILDRIIKEYQNDCSNEEVIIRLLGTAIWGARKNAQWKVIKEIIFKYLMSPKGNVRELARRVLDDYELLFYVDLIDKKYLLSRHEKVTEDQKHPERLLFEIEAMIKSYQPIELPFDVRGQKPSVYKTLLLCWHDLMSRHHLHEKLNYMERMLALNIPILDSSEYKYENDEEEIQEMFFSISDWKKQIHKYYRYQSSAVIDKILKDNQKKALQHMSQILDENNLSSKKKEIIQALQYDESILMEAVMIDIAQTIIPTLENLNEKEIKQKFIQMNKIARSIQSVSDHLIIKGEKMDFSKIMISPVMERLNRCFNFKKIDLESILSSHQRAKRELKILSNLVQKSQIKDVDAYRKRYNLTDHNIENQIEMVGYLIDWFLKSDYMIFTQKEPKRIAAGAWATFQGLNHGFIFIIENEKLMEFAGWNNRSSLYQIKNRFKDLIEEVMEDINIILIDAYPDLEEIMSD